MKTQSKRRPLAERLRASLEEAIRHAEGEITLRTKACGLPEEPPEIEADTIVALRDQSGMSQAIFARMLNVSTKTIQSWEQGVRTPSHASRRLLQIYSENPEAVCRAVGIPTVTLNGVSIERSSGRRKIVVRDEASDPKALAGPPRKSARARGRTSR
ncbi:helix-turn-helix domain-containing protein [Aquisphaera insulae]|uniref:helix-turn-helix domain-containing protein n=1 Tax=Aquisphaera insulae TaxID=2712864 RepID=UPI0013EA9A2D|nr:helix-turn-helix domain-containing protein [Aquisphaera insulae]